MLTSRLIKKKLVSRDAWTHVRAYMSPCLCISMLDTSVVFAQKKDVSSVIC